MFGKRVWCSDLDQRGDSVNSEARFWVGMARQLHQVVEKDGFMISGILQTRTGDRVGGRTDGMRFP